MCPLAVSSRMARVGAARNCVRTMAVPIMFRANWSPSPGLPGDTAPDAVHDSRDEQRRDREIRARAGVDALRLELGVPCAEGEQFAGEGVAGQCAVHRLIPAACLARDTLRHRQTVLAHNV